MLINTEQKFFNLLKALRILTPEGAETAAISDRDRDTLTCLIANGWEPEDAASHLRTNGGRLN